jgi:hypothetical protein
MAGDGHWPKSCRMLANRCAPANKSAAVLYAKHNLMFLDRNEGPSDASSALSAKKPSLAVMSIPLSKQAFLTSKWPASRRKIIY